MKTKEELVSAIQCAMLHCVTTCEACKKCYGDSVDGISQRLQLLDELQQRLKVKLKETE